MWKKVTTVPVTGSELQYWRRVNPQGIEFGGSKLEQTLSGIFWVFDKDHNPKFTNFSGQF